MVKLTEEDLAIIRKHPLKGAFNGLQDVLHKTEQYLTPSPPDEYLTPKQEMPRLLYGAIGQLLFSLINHEASSKITLKGRNRDVCTELYNITKKLSQDM